MERDPGALRAAIAAAREALDEAERLAPLPDGAAIVPSPQADDEPPAELPPLFDPAIGPDLTSDLWITPQQAAGLLRCGERTIRDKLKAGVPFGAMVLGRWYVRRDLLFLLVRAPSKNSAI